MRRNLNFSKSHVSEQGTLSDTVSTDETVPTTMSQSELGVGAIRKGQTKYALIVSYVMKATNEGHTQRTEFGSSQR